MSKRAGDIANALYTLVVTNIAIVVASFILGFARDPQMSLHDAIVIMYLLTISWTSTFFSLPTCVRHKSIETAFGIVYVAQSYAIFALVLAILIKATSFGSTWRCNPHAVVVIFSEFPALNQGRILAIVILAIVVLIYTGLTILDYGLWKRSRYAQFWGWIRENLRRKEEGVEEIQSPGVRRDRAGNGYRIPRDDEQDFYNAGTNNGPRGNSREDDRIRPFVMKGRLMLQLFVIALLWSISVANTELLIVRNRFDGGGDGNGPGLWGFGQILPMFVVLLPLMNYIKVLVELHRTKGRNVRRVHTITVLFKTMFDHYPETPGHPHREPHGFRRASPRTAYDTSPSGWAQFSPFAGINFRAGGGQPSARISVNSLPSVGSTSGERTGDDNHEEVHAHRDLVSISPRRSL